ncbi:hypothetical protein GGI20_003753, partial [Coemansia sp. BCRC 34301]
ALRLVLSPRAVAVLEKYRPLTPVSHPRLQCVKLARASNSESDPFGSGIAFIQFALSIGRNVPVRELDVMLFDREISKVASLRGNHPNTQVLLLPKTSLSLWNALALVKKLPLLMDLHILSPF